MKFVAVAALSAVVGLALAPRSPRAADVERVQRACAELRLKFERVKHPTASAVKALETAHGEPVFVPNVADARIYELFCE